MKGRNGRLTIAPLISYLPHGSKLPAQEQKRGLEQKRRLEGGYRHKGKEAEMREAAKAEVKERGGI